MRQSNSKYILGKNGRYRYFVKQTLYLQEINCSLRLHFPILHSHQLTSLELLGMVQYSTVKILHVNSYQPDRTELT